MGLPNAGPGARSDRSWRWRWLASIVSYGLLAETESAIMLSLPRQGMLAYVYCIGLHTTNGPVSIVGVPFARYCSVSPLS